MSGMPEESGISTRAERKPISRLERPSRSHSAIASTSPPSKPSSVCWRSRFSSTTFWQKGSACAPSSLSARAASTP